MLSPWLEPPSIGQVPHEIHEGTFLFAEGRGHFYPFLTQPHLGWLTDAARLVYTSGLC